jgi:hypothetical protein
MNNLHDAKTIKGLTKELAVQALAAGIAKHLLLSDGRAMNLARLVEILIEAKVTHFRELSGLPPVAFHHPKDCTYDELPGFLDPATPATRPVA